MHDRAAGGEPPETTVAAIEAIAARDVGRGIGPLAAAARGGLLAAARSIAGHSRPHVALVTGFVIASARPPAPETDGPVGAALLAAGLERAGVRVRVVTDWPCMRAVGAALQAAGASPARLLDVVFLGGEAVSALDARWAGEMPRVSHLVAIERVGPGWDGVPRSMHGLDLSASTAPLHRLFEDTSRVTIGIGDGGNEIGMGRLERELVAGTVELGRETHCRVGCDHLIVAGVSNWGAEALLVAIAALRPDLAPRLLDGLDPETARSVLEATVSKGGAVDGVTGRAEPSVDGLGAATHAAILAEMLALVR